MTIMKNIYLVEEKAIFYQRVFTNLSLMFSGDIARIV